MPIETDRVRSCEEIWYTELVMKSLLILTAVKTVIERNLVEGRLCNFIHRPSKVKLYLWMRWFIDLLS